MQVKLKTRCPYILHKWVNIVQLVITWSNYTTEKLLSYSMQCVAHQSKRQISIENGPKYCHNRILKVAQFGHTLCKLVLTCLRIEMTWKLVKSELGLGESKSLYFWLSLLWNPKKLLKRKMAKFVFFSFCFLTRLDVLVSKMSLQVELWPSDVLALVARVTFTVSLEIEKQRSSANLIKHFTSINHDSRVLLTRKLPILWL